MDFISNQQPQIQEMLASIGVKSIEELFAVIPPELRQKRPTEDDGLSEFEGMQLVEKIAAKNTFVNLECYLGAGAYEHHVPAIVGAICSKSEFLTSYTPYQAEASQGMLQIIFEFQSAICALTGMDVSNASLYDGASACGEALLMALRLNKECNKIVVLSSVHPHYRALVRQYLSSHKTRIEEVPFNPNGSFDQQEARKMIDGQTAAVLVQSPNFFGVMEEVKVLAEIANTHEALTVMCANPLSYGIYASAGELGADIAVGDAQPFGLPLQFGGPYVGYIACRQELVRQMPGRIAGEATDANGKRGFVLTLQAREQHIRREKATSNICTNQALAALASLIGMLWYGKQGIPKLALTNYQRTSYLKEKLQSLGFKVMGQAPFFNEFAIDFGVDPEKVQHHFRENGIEPGLELGRFYPALKGYFLVAVTETKSKRQLDRFAEVAHQAKDATEPSVVKFGEQ